MDRKIYTGVIAGIGLEDVAVRLRTIYHAQVYEMVEITADDYRLTICRRRATPMAAMPPSPKRWWQRLSWWFRQ